MAYSPLVGEAIRIMDDIIQQVKARRKQLGVTLRDVAELSGIGLHLLS